MAMHMRHHAIHEHISELDEKETSLLVIPRGDQSDPSWWSSSSSINCCDESHHGRLFPKKTRIRWNFVLKRMMVSVLSLGSIFFNLLSLNNLESAADIVSITRTLVQPRHEPPRQVFLEGPPNSFDSASVQLLAFKEMSCLEDCRGFIEDPVVLSDEHAHKFDGYDDQCEPGQDWKASHPACNDVHSFSFADRLVLNQGSLIKSQGSWRRAWEMKDVAGNATNAWKTLILEKFDIDAAKLERVLEENRVDAAAMEQLTLSTAVVNVYGYCGASLITEFVGASLENLIHAREMPNNPFVSDIQPAKKLSIALDIATGVATMHNINGRPGFSSNDLHIGNIFFDSQMRPKLNDFNLALFLMTRPNETGVMCHSVRREGMVDAGWRPPEEYLDVTDTSISVISSNSAEDETPAVRVWPDKVDVFALGSIMYTLLVGYDPWWESGEEEHEAFRDQMIALKVKGGHLPFPKEVQESLDPAVQTLIRAIKSCHNFHPTERPTAMELVEILERKGHGHLHTSA